MNKKFLSLFLTLVLICCSSVCFATNAGTEVRNSAEKSGSTLEDMGNGIRNVAEDVGNGIQGAASSVGNGIQDMFDGNDNNKNNQTMMGGTNTGRADGYTATRTNANTNTGMSNTAWVWLILGITGVVIVALTWYYVTQDTSRKR